MIFINSKKIFSFLHNLFFTLNYIFLHLQLHNRSTRIFRHQFLQHIHPLFSLLSTRKLKMPISIRSSYNHSIFFFKSDIIDMFTANIASSFHFWECAIFSSFPRIVFKVNNSFRFSDNGYIANFPLEEKNKNFGGKKIDVNLFEKIFKQKLFFNVNLSENFFSKKIYIIFLAGKFFLM